MSLTPIDGGAGVPSEPNWRLSYSDDLGAAAASEAWREIIDDLRSRNLLAVTNGHAIRRLVEFRALYDRAAREVAEHGQIVKAPKTGTPQISPFWTVMKQASEQCSSHEAELGLAPRRRAAATPPPRRKPSPRAADAYLKPVDGGKSSA